MRNFSSRVIDAPGDCSPSRKVVSNMINLSAISLLLWICNFPQLRTVHPKTKGPLREQTGLDLEISARALLFPPVLANV